MKEIPMLKKCKETYWLIKIFHRKLHSTVSFLYNVAQKEFIIRVCIQKFPDWPPGARTANGRALCHYVQLYRHFVSESSEFYRRNLCVASQRVILKVSLYLVMTKSGNFWIHPIMRPLFCAF